MTMHNSRVVFGSIGIFATPIIVVKLAAFAAGAGSPSPASANEVASNPVGDIGVSEVHQIATPEQVEAFERAHALRTLKGVNSPLLYSADVELPGNLTVDPLDEQFAPAPEVLVQGLMGGSAPKAVIDGILYSVGDSLQDAPTWTVLKITLDLREVVLFEPESDRTISIKVIEGR